MGLDIYIGAEVEYESERILLTEIDRVWSLDPRPTIVLANINLGDRQIDAVAIRDGLVLVLEAKKFARPVRGTVNGWWQVQLASGAWRECPNAWTQVLGEKNALRDAMRDFDRTVSGFYPQASVVFMPDIPPGSQLPAGDYKASVIGGSGFAVRLGEVHGNCWDFVRWREFAAHHGLRKVASLASAISADLLTAETRLAEYADHYSRTYAAEADEFIDSPCLVENEQDSSKAVIERIVDGQSNILVNGSSGCGKTLLAKKVGVSALQSGVIPFHVRANEFEGSIKSLLEREAGLLSSASAAAILGAVRRLDRRLLLIVDGYNECGAEMRAMLTRAIAALARRYAATVLVTSQIPLAHPELVTAKEVTVPPPSAELKREIASKAMGGHFRSPELDDLLVSVTTGLEAHLVGAVGLKAGAEASRFALFDAFVRMRLGSAARDGIRALSLLAGWLTDRYTFGISVRDMDRLSEENSVAPSVASLLLDRKLLVRRGDRLTFSHELFLNALAAESVVRRSGGDAQRIAFAIDSPVHADSATLIVGAIDDHGLLVRVLGQMSSAGLLAACKSGACGKAALEWVNARIPSLFEKMREELRHVQFRIDTSAWSSVAIDINADGFWTSGERALIACIPDLMATGTLLDEVLGVIEDMDGLIARERERLKDAARVEKIGLRTAMFASAYVVQRPDAPAIAQVCSRLHGGLFRRATSAALMRRMR